MPHTVLKSLQPLSHLILIIIFVQLAQLLSSGNQTRGSSESTQCFGLAEIWKSETQAVLVHGKPMASPLSRLLGNLPASWRGRALADHPLWGPLDRTAEVSSI